MSGRRLFRLALAATALFVAAPALADEPPPAIPEAHDLDAIDRSAQSAMDEQHYGFCTEPRRPLGLHQKSLCSLASRVDHCEGLVAACEAAQIPKADAWAETLLVWLAPLARALLYILVLGIVLLIAVPVLQALRKRRRDRGLTKADAASPNVGTLVADAPDETSEASSAEATLRRAAEHEARGELEEALGLYLVASLAALDRRGAIRIARDRTNGEYVRACAENASRSELREIVREVDKVEFGGTLPTSDAVGRAGARATEIVHRTTTALLLVAVVLGCSTLSCGAARPGSDPAGDELPREVLRRNGFTVGSLGSSLATMPLADTDKATPVVVVDTERVSLEEEAQAHLARWVEEGGVLVLFGRAPPGWPSVLAQKAEPAATDRLIVHAPPPFGDLEDGNDETAVDVDEAHTARWDAFTYADATPLAHLGGRTYAAKRYVGKGIVLAVANDDLFTNVGVLPRRNAAALVTLLRSVSHDPRRILSAGARGPSALGEVRVARAEDGIPPPSNPFAALAAAGLAKAAWHSLAAAMLLFLAYGIRHARARPRARQARRAFAEHVEATGAFYARAHADSHALRVYGRYLESRLREIVPRGTDPVSFLAARSGVAPERAAELYARAQNAKAEDPARGDELQIIEELRRMIRTR